MRSRNKIFKFPVSILLGSTPLNILKVIKGFRIDSRYWVKFLLTVIISLIFGLLNLPERLIYRLRVKKVTERQPPVFVIGFWRSGTTLLHSLLCQDKQSAYVTTFQGVFPNLVLTQKRWLKSFTNNILPKKRPFDSYPMDMDFPQEEEFAMMSLHPRSIYKVFYFPKDFDRIYQSDLHFERLQAKYRKGWEKKYITLVNKAMMSTGGSRYVSKNPCNIFRIKTLINLFPDARFIFIYRNPYLVVESLTNFMNAILPGSELQHLEGGIRRESIARLYKDSMDEYSKAKGLINPENLMEIKYEEFKDYPLTYLQEFYEKMNMPGFEKALPAMELYLKKTNPDARKSYVVPQETYRIVNEYAGDIVNKLGYEVVENNG